MKHNSAGRTAARTLGDFISRTRYRDLPSVEQLRAKVRLLDAATSVLAGRSSPATALALGFARRVQSPGRSSFWLSGEKGSAENCAFANSILIHGVLLDDWPVHTACVVAPSALAVAEEEGRSGEDVLAAIALGYEVSIRLDSDHLSHDAMVRGFRHSSVNATFAATTTAAYLMGLDGEGVKDALALTTATLNPGTMEPMGKSGGSERFVQMAANAKNGVLAAALAKEGFKGSDTAFEGRAGLFYTYAQRPDLPAGVLDGLGKVWHLDTMATKPYPCSGAGTLPIYCAERLASLSAFEYTDIARIELDTRSWGHMTGVIDPGPYINTEQAMVSACFGIASTLVYGSYDFDILMKALRDPRVDALAQRIEAKGSKGAGDDSEVKVTLADGRVFSASSKGIPDTMMWPTDWDNMVQRFHRLARSAPAEVRERIVDEISVFDQRRTCDGLVQLLRWIE